MLDILFWCLFVIGSFFISYVILKNLYGKDCKKWKPIVFTKDVTFKSIFLSRNRAETETKESQKKHG